jgi:O-antigen/teichoic acid export membrane protein
MLKSIWNKVFGKGANEGQGGLVHKSLFTLAIKSISILIGFSIVLMLSNTLGAEQLGHYQYAFTWVSLLVLVAMVGFDRLLIREMPRLNSNGEPGKIKGLLSWSNQLLLPSSIIVTALAFLASYWDFKVFEDPDTVLTYRVALTSIPLLVFIAQRHSALAGIKEVVVAKIPSQIVQPALFLVGLATVYLFADQGLDATTAIVINIGSVAVTLIVIIALFRAKSPKAAAIAIDPKQRRTLLRVALPILGFNLAMLMFSRLDILMLQHMVSAKAVGLYSIPLKLSTYLSLILVSFNTVIAPNISELFSQNRHAELQKLTTKVARITTLIAIPTALLLIFAADYILPVFGPEFTVGKNVLLFLVIGQLVNIFCGPVGNLLIMTKHEVSAMLCFTFSTIVNFGLNLWLIPLHGIEGAAIATAISLGLNNVLMLFVVGVKLKINPSVFFFGKR